jgi:hypothetical protein
MVLDLLQQHFHRLKSPFDNIFCIFRISITALQVSSRDPGA